MLLSEGHIHARRYPLQFMWSEARIVRQRQNAKTCLDASVMQTILSTVLGGKQANTNLKKLLREIANSD